MAKLRIGIDREDDGGFIAGVPDLPGVMAYGATTEDAHSEPYRIEPFRYGAGLGHQSDRDVEATSLQSWVQCQRGLFSRNSVVGERAKSRSAPERAAKMRWAFGLVIRVRMASGRAHICESLANHGRCSS